MIPGSAAARRGIRPTIGGAHPERVMGDITIPPRACLTEVRAIADSTDA